MRPIRVAHVVNNIGFCGVRTVVFHLLRDLSKRGYELHVFCVIKQPEEHLDVQRQHIEAFEALGVRVHLADPAKKTIFVMEDICRALDELEIDIVHTHSHKPNLFGRLAGVLCGNVKIIAHYHSEYRDKWREGGSLLLDFVLGNRTHRLIAVSKSVQKVAAKKIGISRGRIEVIPNGVDFERYAVEHDGSEIRCKLGVPESHRVLGLVGRISPPKRQKDFIAAAPKIRETFPDTTFLIIGRAENSKELTGLQKLTEELGLQEHVRFTGFQSDMPRVLSALDILVMPSRWEGHPTALLEAMASGTPVIASNIKSIAAVVADGETAMLVPVRSPEAIASAAAALLGDPARARSLAEAGRERAREFSWSRASNRIDAIYKELMAPTRAKQTTGTLFLVRHGQTAWSGERHIGWSDVGLDATGIAQAQAITDALRHEPIQAIYSSPLSRALETVEGLSEQLGVRICCSDDLKELHMGQLEGKLRSEYPLGSRLDYFYTPIPGGESLYELHQRAQTFAAEVGAELALGRNIVIVGHYQILIRIYNALQGKKFEQSLKESDFRPETGSIYRIRYSVAPVATTFEDTGFLP